MSPEPGTPTSPSAGSLPVVPTRASALLEAGRMAIETVR